ncbi:uncharacterized protein LOC144097978 [Amblyomma americanum]
MCWSSTKTTLLFTAVVCIGMNGFNLASRALGFRDKLLEDKTAAYIPDVNDLSKWVNGRKNSDNIIMGLAGVSLVFDIVLLGGALQERGGLIQISGLWGSFDCVVDAVIGFLSANYTMPSFQETKTADVPAKGRLRRRHRSKGHSYEMLQVMKAADELSFIYLAWICTQRRARQALTFCVVFFSAAYWQKDGRNDTINKGAAAIGSKTGPPLRLGDLAASCQEPDPVQSVLLRGLSEPARRDEPGECGQGSRRWGWRDRDEHYGWMTDVTLDRAQLLMPASRSYTTASKAELCLVLLHGGKDVNNSLRFC